MSEPRVQVYHWWDTYVGGGTPYTSTAILGNSCAYEYTGLNRGLKTGSSFWTNSSGSFADAWDETYGYDANFDYLTSFSTTDGQSNASQSWTYDQAGNRATDYTGSSWAYDNLNRMSSNGPGTSYSNDILGNRTALGSTVSYAWDCLNRMTGYTGSSGTESYVYRADGMRVSKSNSSASTLYRYDGQMGIEDVDTASAAVTTTEYGLGSRGVDYMAATNGSGTSVSFPIYDAHGNMVATLARSGSSYSIANQRDFDPWGNIRGGSTTSDPKGRYCANAGHKQDDESGLLYMRARYYDAGCGRFLSQDPSRMGANWLTYCSNNPVKNQDCSGRDPGDAEDVMDQLMLLFEKAQSIFNSADSVRGMTPSQILGSIAALVTIAKDIQMLIGYSGFMMRTYLMYAGGAGGPEAADAEEGAAGLYGAAKVAGLAYGEQVDDMMFMLQENLEEEED